jgi:hypothetical protein
MAKGPNFNPTGGNTAPQHSTSHGKSGLKSQKGAMDFNKFGAGIAKTTGTSDGSGSQRRGSGKSSTFMNK